MAQSNIPGKLSGAALRMQQNINFKRTIIPPMLTCGCLLPVFGLWILVGGEEMPLSGQNLFALTLLVMGLIVLAGGIFTMMQVRHMLIEQNRR